VGGTKFLSISDTGGTAALRILHQACPTAPWDMYGLFVISGGIAQNWIGGLEVDDGTKVVTLYDQLDGGSSNILQDTWTTTSSQAGSVSSVGFQGQGVPVWFHINNTSGSLTYYYSFDGLGWRLFGNPSAFVSANTNCGIVLLASSSSTSGNGSTTVLDFQFGPLAAQ
jgi:hypothetical protein